MKTDTTVHIHTDSFEGPLELLLELVEKRKMLINDISLAEVTDEYMKTVAKMQEQSLPNTAQFIALAATLLLIKSKSLLPVLDLTDDEEERIENLEEKLKYYQIFKEAGEELRQQYDLNPLYKRGEITETPLFLPDSYCTVDALKTSIIQLVAELPIPEQKKKVQVTPVVTLEETIDKLRKTIQEKFKTSFSEFTQQETEKKAVAVSFLAVLELCKQGSIIITQSQHFDEILIEATQFETPHYK